VEDSFYNTGVVNHKFILAIDDASIKTIYNKTDKELINQFLLEIYVNDFLPQDIVKDDKEGIIYYRAIDIDMNEANKNIEKLKKKFDQENNE
jgi:hypothetical protein